MFPNILTPLFAISAKKSEKILCLKKKAESQIENKEKIQRSKFTENLDAKQTKLSGIKQRKPKSESDPKPSTETNHQLLMELMAKMDAIMKQFQIQPSKLNTGSEREKAVSSNESSSASGSNQEEDKEELKNLADLGGTTKQSRGSSRKRKKLKKKKSKESFYAGEALKDLKLIEESDENAGNVEISSESDDCHEKNIERLAEFNILTQFDEKKKDKGKGKAKEKGSTNPFQHKNK